jgi:hypothetical protein
MWMSRKRWALTIALVAVGVAVGIRPNIASSAWECVGATGNTHYDHKECNASTDCTNSGCISVGQFACSGTVYAHAKMANITTYGTACSTVEVTQDCTLCAEVRCAEGKMWSYFNNDCLTEKCAVAVTKVNACTFDS